MPRAGRYSPEMRGWAVRMVFEDEREYSSQWAAIVSISSKIGSVLQRYWTWVRRVEIDAGWRGGLTSDERARTKELAGVRSEA